MQTRKFWMSPNFILAVIIAVGGFFVGFPEGAAREAVTSLFALVGSAGVLYKFFKGKPGTQAKTWLGDANLWNYLYVIFAAISPTIAESLMGPAGEVVKNIVQGNWGGAIMAAISLVTIIIKIVQSPPEAKKLT